MDHVPVLQVTRDVPLGRCGAPRRVEGWSVFGAIAQTEVVSCRI